MKRVKHFLINTIILTLTALLLRTIGVSFNVYLSNKIGASGIGLFGLIMSIYAFSVTFASSGIRLATTRLVVEEISRGNESGINLIVRRCLLYSIFFGSIAAFILFRYAEAISVNFLFDHRPVLSLRVLALSLPFLAMSSALSGYFTARRKALMPSTVQIFEQFLKILISVVGIYFLLPYGMEYACVALVIGACLSEVLSFMVLFFFYFFDIRKSKKSKAHSVKGTGKKLLAIALPDAVSSYVRSALVTIEHLLIPVGLKKSGASYEKALADYGTVSGMVLPIILYPSALTGSLASLLVPEIAECHARGHIRNTNYIITRVLQLTLYFAIGVSGILYSFSLELGTLIYHSMDASIFIKILAPLVPIMYLDTTVDSMLKGLGQQTSSMKYNIIDSAISVLFVYFLLPKWAIMGYVATIYVTELLNFTLSIRRLTIISPFRLSVFTCVIKPIFCILGATSSANLLFLLTGLFIPSDILSLLLKIIFTGIFYLVSLFIMSCFTKSDVQWFLSIFKES